MLMQVFWVLVEANEALGATPREAFVLAFRQALVASGEELELLGRA
jgi:hypothetical protein